MSALECDLTRADISEAFPGAVFSDRYDRMEIESESAEHKLLRQQVLVHLRKRGFRCYAGTVGRKGVYAFADGAYLRGRVLHLFEIVSWSMLFDSANHHSADPVDRPQGGDGGPPWCHCCEAQVTARIHMGDPIERKRLLPLSFWVVAPGSRDAETVEHRRFNAELIRTRFKKDDAVNLINQRTGSFAGTRSSWLEWFDALEEDLAREKKMAAEQAAEQDLKRFLAWQSEYDPLSTVKVEGGDVFKAFKMTIDAKIAKTPTPAADFQRSVAALADDALLKKFGVAHPERLRRRIAKLGGLEFLPGYKALLRAVYP